MLTAGLLRAELILTDALRNRHPRDLIARGEQDTLVDSWPPPSAGSPPRSRHGR